MFSNPFFDASYYTSFPLSWILGFVDTLLHDLWFSLEGGHDDNKTLSPRIKETNVEKTLHKVILRLHDVLCIAP